MKQPLFIATLLFGSLLSAAPLESAATIVERIHQELPSRMSEVRSPGLKISSLPGHSFIQSKSLACDEVSKLSSQLASYQKDRHTLSIVSLEHKFFGSCLSEWQALRKKQVIQETFKAYDLKHKISNVRVPGCQPGLGPKNKTKNNVTCKRLRRQNQRKSFISDDLRFINLGQLHGRNNKNNRSSRVLHPKELNSRADFAALNFSSFALEPDYKCRRPGLYAYFQDHFQWDPSKGTQCENRSVFLNTEPRNSLRTIDPDRVYRIDYLLASSGSSPMSWFGHSMFRIAICAPEGVDPATGEKTPATEYGPNCLADIDHHIVVNYAAFIDDSQIDTWGGLSGKYPSTMSLRPLRQVAKEYNDFEMRTLQAYPLDLDEQKKRLFLKRAIESYWDYSGTYRFFSTNCASESYKLVAGLYSELAPHLKEPILPTKVLRLFDQYQWLNRPIKSPLTIPHTDLFRGKLVFYEKIIQSLNNLGFKLASDMMPESLFEKGPQERARIYGMAFKDASPSKEISVQLVALFLSIERISAKKFQKKLDGLKTKRILQLAKGRMDLNVSKILSPQMVLTSGYGIANALEVRKIVSYRNNLASSPEYQKTLIEVDKEFEIYNLKHEEIDNNIFYLIKKRKKIKQGDRYEKYN